MRSAVVVVVVVVVNVVVVPAAFGLDILDVVTPVVAVEVEVQLAV